MHINQVQLKLPGIRPVPAACPSAAEPGGAPMDALRVAVSRDLLRSPGVFELGHSSMKVRSVIEQDVFDPFRLSASRLCRPGEHGIGLERWRRGVLPRHTHAGPRSAGRRGPSSGDLELTCLNTRRFLPVHTTFSTSASCRYPAHPLFSHFPSFPELQSA